MKSPNNRSTVNRDDMICPSCGTEGLVEDKKKSGDYRGIYEIEKASRCTNEDCPYYTGVPEDLVDIQTPNGTLKRITSNLNGPDISAKDLVVYVFGIAVILAILVNYGIIPIGSDSDNQQVSARGDIVSISGNLPEDSDISSVLLYNNTTEVLSVESENSTYSIQSREIENGNYSIYLNYSNRLSPKGKTVSITDSEEGNTTRTVNFTDSGESFNIDLNRTTNGGNLSITYNNPTNTRDIDLGVSPIESQIIDRSRLIDSSTREILIPGFPSNQEYEVTAPETEKIFTRTKEYTGDPVEYSIRGNIEAKQLKVIVPEDIGGDTVQSSISVPETGRTETIQILSNETVSPVSINIRDGSANRFNQVTGFWTGQEVQYLNASDNQTGFQRSRIQITPRVKTSSQSIEGQTQNESINPRYEGNSNITDAKIQFTSEGIGSVLVDTNRDGEFECEVSINGGVCRLESFNPDNGQINISKTGVSSLEYRINYTSRVRPENVSLDVGNNGVTDALFEGVIDETISQFSEIPQQNVSLAFKSDNSVGFDYSITWIQEGIVDDPVVQIGSETVVSGEGSFVGSRSYDIGKLEQGEYDVKFSSDSGGYVADITWQTQEGKSIPGVTIDGERVCQPTDFNEEFECLIETTGLSQGNHELQFTQTTSDTFSFQIEQVARAVATDIQVTVNGTRQDVINIPFGSPQPWNSTSQINSYQSGRNSVDISIPSEGGINPNATVKLNYQIDTGVVNGLSIDVFNEFRNSSISVSIPNDAVVNGNVISDFSSSIPSSVFGLGRNTISFNSESGLYTINSTIPVHSDDNLEFNP